MFGWFKEEKKRTTKKNNKKNETAATPPQFYKIVPLTPFGYKTTWLAVESASSTEVAEAIMAFGYRDFQVTESWNGWVFVQNMLDSIVDFSKVTAINDAAEDAAAYWALLRDSNCMDEKNLTVLKKLSENFASICFFVNHRVSDCYAWVKCEDGEVVRAFEYIEGYGVVIDLGVPTEEEDDLDIYYSEYNLQNENNEEDIDSPNENDVIEIAEAWSCLPSS